MARHLGRKPRAYDQRIPHYSSLVAGRRKLIAPPPVAVDYTSKMPANFGQMLNDSLGDCTCAALAHAVQVTSFASGSEITPPDNAVLTLYESACGYDPADPSTDQGGVEQNVLKYVMANGIQTGAAPVTVSGFVEVDPRSIIDLRRVIYECGFVYIGVDLPTSWENTNHWTKTPDEAPIAGGHAIILAGYDMNGFTGISWGEIVTVDISAILQRCDEAYAVMLSTWFETSGKTIAGLSQSDLTAMMQSLA
jgi:hypothetical protein